MTPASFPAAWFPACWLPIAIARDEYSGQWNLSLQHALTNSLSLQAAYGEPRAQALSGRLAEPDRSCDGIRPHADIGPAGLPQNSGEAGITGFK